MYQQQQLFVILTDLFKSSVKRPPQGGQTHEQ